MKSIVQGLCIGLTVCVISVVNAHASEPLAVRVRHPVAIATVGAGNLLVTANQRSGTISILAPNQADATRECAVGKRLSDVIGMPNSQRLLVTDEEIHELIAVRISQTDCTVEKRLAVSPFPVNVRISRDGKFAFVASLWSRTVSVVDLTGWLSNDVDAAKSVVSQIRLPFCPREQLVIDTQDQQRVVPAPSRAILKLVVADAFGSKLAVIDPQAGTVESVREIPGHAIRAMQLDPKKPRVVMTHQLLNRQANTQFDDIHWGNLMTNCLRSLDLADVLDSQSDLLSHSVLDYIGGPEQGAGDPAGFVMLPNGVVGIALSGVDEFISDNADRLFSSRLKTGACPTAIALSADRAKAYVVNTLDDSITVIDVISTPSVSGTISLGPRPELTPVERGEILFHSAKLSHDGWLSCASCHVQGHTNGKLNDNFTDSTFGTPKRVLSLRGAADSAPYAWNGRFATLSEQIQHSVKSTMQGEPLTETQTNDLEAFLRSLPPAPAIGSNDSLAKARGRDLFKKLDCQRCHMEPSFTSSRVVDVDLKDERGARRFNPPSLRGVSQNGPYFHDARAATLADVFRKYRHQVDRELSDDELRDLIAFLEDL